MSTQSKSAARLKAVCPSCGSEDTINYWTLTHQTHEVSVRGKKGQLGIADEADSSDTTEAGFVCWECGDEYLDEDEIVKATRRRSAASASAGDEAAAIGAKR